MKKVKLKNPKLPKISKVRPAKVKPIKMKMGGPPPSGGRGRRKKDMF